MSRRVLFGNHLNYSTVFIRIDGEMLYDWAGPGYGSWADLSAGSTIELWTDNPEDVFWDTFCLRAYTYDTDFKVEYTTRYDNHVFLTVLSVGTVVPPRGYLYVKISYESRDTISVSSRIEMYLTNGEPIDGGNGRLARSGFTTNGSVEESGWSTFYISTIGPYYVGDPNNPIMPTFSGTGDSFIENGITFTQAGYILDYDITFQYVGNFVNPSIIPVGNAQDLSQVGNLRLWRFCAGTPDEVLAHGSQSGHYQQTAHIMNREIRQPNSIWMRHLGSNSSPPPSFTYDGDGYVIKNIKFTNRGPRVG